MRRLIACLAVVAMASGCGIIGRAPTDIDTDSPEVVKLRESAQAKTSRMADALTPTGQSLGAAHVDGCLVGEWSWKFRDDFQHRCSYVAGSAVAFPSVPAGIVAARRFAEIQECVPVGPDPFLEAEKAFREVNGTRTSSPYERDADLPTGHMNCDGLEVDYRFLNPARTKPSPVTMTNPFHVTVSKAEFAPHDGTGRLILVIEVTARYYEVGW